MFGAFGLFELLGSLRVEGLLASGLGFFGRSEFSSMTTRIHTFHEVQ